MITKNNLWILISKDIRQSDKAQQQTVCISLCKLYKVIFILKIISKTTSTQHIRYKPIWWKMKQYNRLACIFAIFFFISTQHLCEL